MPAKETQDSDSGGFEPIPAGGRLHDEPEHVTFDHDVSFTSAHDETFEDDTLPMISNLPPPTFNPGGTNTLYTVFLIVNAALGAGLLNFPKAFDEAGGIGVATAVQGVLMIFIVLALLILAHSADRCDSAATTIQDTMNGACGRVGKILTSAAVVVYTFGTTITFLIIIGDQFDRALASLYGQDFCQTWYMARTFTMSAAAILFILPLSYSQKIDFLRIPSTLGVLAIVYLVGLIVYEYFSGQYPDPGPIKHRPDNWTDVFLVVPQVCFGYQCHVSVIPIYSCMRHRTIKHFTAASVTAIAICLLCYTLSAAFGYLTFGSFVNEDIMLSYSASQPQVMAGIVALTLKTITTYPILLFCGREGLKSILMECHQLWTKGRASNVPPEASPGPPSTTSSQDTPDFLIPGSKKEVLIRVVFVTVWFVLSLVLAIKIPNIGQVIKMLGSLAAVFIFVFPGLCLFNISYRSDPSFVRKKTWTLVSTSVAFLAIGGFIFGVVFTQSLQGILQTDEEVNRPFYLLIREQTC